MFPKTATTNNLTMGDYTWILALLRRYNYGCLARHDDFSAIDFAMNKAAHLRLPEPFNQVFIRHDKLHINPNPLTCRSPRRILYKDHRDGHLLKE